MKKGIKSINQGKGRRMEPDVDGKEVLTVVEVADLLRMKPIAIYNAIRHGVVPGLKIGNRWRLSRQAVLEALSVRK